MNVMNVMNVMNFDTYYNMLRAEQRVADLEANGWSCYLTKVMGTDEIIVTYWQETKPSSFQGLELI